MAKVIRNCWVYKKHGARFRYLPRRRDGSKEYDFQKHDATPDTFPERLDSAPPKLWLAWIYRSIDREPHYTRQRVRDLFGDDCKPGKMTVFKNTAAFNAQLWHVKHLLELRPLTFPDGEPTVDDVNYIEVMPDGRCTINKELQFDDSHLRLADPRKQFTAGELASRLTTRYAQCKDVFEDNVYTPANISVQD